MDTFLTTYALHVERDVPPAAGAARAMPAELQAWLATVKRNSYADGFFQFVSAGDCAPYFSLWGLDAGACFGFLKCAFGHVVFHHEGQYKALNPVYNCIDELGDEGDLEFVFDTLLCDREGMEASYFIDIYEHAFTRLGAPAINEMYAFVPALGLGGTRDAASVEKKPMRSEMAILAQL